VDYCKALHFDPCCLPARVNLAHTLQVSLVTYYSNWSLLPMCADGREIPTVMESLHLCSNDWSKWVIDHSVSTNKDKKGS